MPDPKAHTHWNLWVRFGMARAMCAELIGILSAGVALPGLQEIALKRSQQADKVQVATGVYAPSRIHRSGHSYLQRQSQLAEIDL